MVNAGKHLAPHYLALGKVRVAGEDEGVDAHGPVGLEFGQYLVGVANDGRPCAAAGPTDARPQTIFHETVVAGEVTQLSLAGHPDRGSV